MSIINILSIIMIKKIFLIIVLRIKKFLYICREIFATIIRNNIIQVTSNYFSLTIK